ncbi:procathepsin L-like [Leucoraja erinacea]|uniref:procathepsin L-like n=1 Tax=Leucoraja erinaceus TaxID=7782 RepID=UPI0024570E8E|nr:procathepsin L-like [Leucoraja erinacea]XP_055514799.1 procathepsin L-like [Leucoraja erinacea]
MELSIFVMFISSVIATVPATSVLFDVGLEELPAITQSKNWADEGYVTSIRNQKRCAACWAFTAVATVEGQMYNKTNNLTELSEQNLIDCAVSYRGRGCSGGWVYRAYNYIRDTGIESSISYPYQGKQTNCSLNSSSPVSQISGYRRLKNTDETTLMQLVESHGPISVAVHMSRKFSQFKGTGIFDDPACNKSVNHAVTVIGYMHSPTEKYWIIKNSWGVNWGDNGFMKMIMGKNMCKITAIVDYPIY